MAATTIVGLMFGLSYLTGRGHDVVAGTLRGRTPQIKHWGGRLMVLVGAWLIALGIWSPFFAELLF